MSNSNDWQESQNDNYLKLLITRLSQPKLKWVNQFTNIINTKVEEFNGSSCVDRTFLLNDFGCNVGHFFRGVEDIKFAINYLGYDISETYLEIAKNKFGAKYFESLDLASDSTVNVPREADISVISATLEHIENYEAAIKSFVAKEIEDNE